MDEAKDILILRYLEGELTATEKAAFEAELRQDEKLQKDLKAYQALIHGVKQQERAKMKMKVAAIGAGLGAASLIKYQPKPPSGGANFIGKAFKFFLATGGIAVVGSLVLIYLDKFPFEHPSVEIIKEKLIEIEQGQVTHIDTIYRTIEVQHIENDTILYGQEEYDNYMKELEGQAYE